MSEQTLAKGGVRMKLYAISDPHHSFGVDKPMDIFNGWNNYVERLEENWQKTVLPEDTVVIAGDISWGMTLEEAKADFAFLDHLNGTKIILKGNHDLWFSTKTKVDAFLAENGFDSIKILFNNHYPFGEYGICGTRGWINEPGEAQNKKVILREAGRLERSLESAKADGKTPLVFLHYPPVSLKTDCEEILEVIHRYDVTQVYYGHLHGPAHQYAATGRYDGVFYHLISCDFTKFEPVKVMEINDM